MIDPRRMGLFRVAKRGFLDGIPDPMRGGFLMAKRGFLDGKTGVS